MPLQLLLQVVTMACFGLCLAFATDAFRCIGQPWDTLSKNEIGELPPPSRYAKGLMYLAGLVGIVSLTLSLMLQAL